INIGLTFVPVDDWIEKYGLRGFRMYMKFIQLLDFLFGTIATLALARLVEATVRGETLTWRNALWQAFKRWPAALGTSFIGGLIILGLLFLLIVPGLIWGLYYSLVLYVVALRGLSGKSALDYSKALVKGQWWRVLGLLIVFNLLSAAIALILGVPFIFTPDHPVLDVVDNTIGDLASALSLVLVSVLMLNTDYVRQRQTPPALPLPTPSDTGAQAAVLTADNSP
ncbi:MAG: hypothetical protein NTY53_23420, partial [Kiritimatiellaeota bacterium]|nr:hypothetical protein [Kiritimatiellota bacterium]